MDASTEHSISQIYAVDLRQESSPRLSVFLPSIHGAVPSFGGVGVTSNKQAGMAVPQTN